jgi:hypothetical protein
MPQRVTRSAVLVALVLGLAACLIIVRYVATTQETPAAIGARDEPRLETARPTPAASEPHDRSVRDVTPQGVSRVFMPPLHRAASAGRRRRRSASARPAWR